MHIGINKEKSMIESRVNKINKRLRDINEINHPRSLSIINMIKDNEDSQQSQMENHYVFPLYALDQSICYRSHQT